MNRFPVTSLLVALLLSSCAAPYREPPATAPTARLRVMQLERGAQTAVRQLHGACVPADDAAPEPHKIAMLAGRAAQVQPHLRKSLEMPGAPPDEGDFTEVRVAAERPFHLRVTRSEGLTGVDLYRVQETLCTVAVSFTPAKGADYEAALSRRPGGCLLTLTKLSQDDGGKVSRTSVPTTRIEQACR